MKILNPKEIKPIDRFSALSRNLLPSEIEFKVNSVVKKKDTVYALIVPYKDSRVDMSILDDVCGKDSWQNVYNRDSNGILQCGIGIYSDKHKSWIWKYSNGVKSDYEPEKGEYSDAFKRAGFMWGIGRGLYSFPMIFIKLREGEYYMEVDKVRASRRFKPSNLKWRISYVDGLVTSIFAVERRGGKEDIRFSYIKK